MMMISFQIFYALEKGFKEYSHLLKLKPIKIMVFVSIDNFIIFSRDSKSLEGGGSTLDYEHWFWVESH